MLWAWLSVGVSVFSAPGLGLTPSVLPVLRASDVAWGYASASPGLPLADGRWWDFLASTIT